LTFSVNPIPYNCNFVSPLLGAHLGSTLSILLGEKNMDDFIVQKISVNFLFSTFKVTYFGYFRI